jgi:hypothetical protein
MACKPQCDWVSAERIKANAIIRATSAQTIAHARSRRENGGNGH